jgi:type IV secretory pathway VirB2 component (pilin)
MTMANLLLPKARVRSVSSKGGFARPGLSRTVSSRLDPSLSGASKSVTEGVERQKPAWRWFPVTALALIVLIITGASAFAQNAGGVGLEPIDNAAKQLESFLRGTFAKTCMAIAIALTGYVCATGRAPWFWFGLCIIACALIFGAPKIVEFFSTGTT